MTTEHASDFLPLSLSASLGKEDLHYLQPMLEWRSAVSGECLWREGDRDDRVGLVLSGRVKLLKETENPGHPLVVGLFGPGSLIMDFAFPDEGPLETSAYAAEDLDVVFLSRADFGKILQERPQLGQRMFHKALTSVTEQLRHAYRRLAVHF